MRLPEAWPEVDHARYASPLRLDTESRIESSQTSDLIQALAITERGVWCETVHGLYQIQDNTPPTPIELERSPRAIARHGTDLWIAANRRELYQWSSADNGLTEPIAPQLRSPNRYDQLAASPDGRFVAALVVGPSECYVSVVGEPGVLFRTGGFGLSGAQSIGNLAVGHDLVVFNEFPNHIHIVRRTDAGWEDTAIQVDGPHLRVRAVGRAGTLYVVDDAGLYAASLERALADDTFTFEPVAIGEQGTRFSGVVADRFGVVHVLTRGGLYWIDPESAPLEATRRETGEGLGLVWQHAYLLDTQDGRSFAAASGDTVYTFSVDDPD